MSSLLPKGDHPETPNLILITETQDKLVIYRDMNFICSLHSFKFSRGKYLE